MKAVLLILVLGLLTINSVRGGFFDKLVGNCKEAEIEKIREKYYVAEKNLYLETLLNRAATIVCQFQNDTKCDESLKTKNNIGKALKEMQQSKADFSNRIRSCDINPLLENEIRTPITQTGPVPCYWDKYIVDYQPSVSNLNNSLRIQEEQYQKIRQTCKDDNCPALAIPKLNLVKVRENFVVFDLFLRSLKERSFACRTPQAQGNNVKVITHQITHIIHRTYPDLIRIYPGLSSYHFFSC